MKKNIYLYYIITACQAAWFTESIWYFYFRRFTDYSTMGVVFAILNIFWIAYELPTGVLADKFGRRLSSIMGSFIVTAGTLLTGFATGFWMWVMSLTTQDLGRAFISGSLEALIYDDLKNHNKEHEYPKIVATKGRIRIATYAIAVILGGFMGHIDLRIPYFMAAFFSFVSLIAAWLLSESKIKSSDQIISPFQTTIEGLRQFRVPGLQPYILLSWGLLFTYFVFDWGLTKPAMAVKFGYFEREQGIIYAIISIITFFALGYIPKIRKKMNDLAGLKILALMVIFTFIVAIFPLGIMGFIPIMLIEMVGSFSDPWISTIMNKHIDSRYRATTLSALQMAGRLPYLAINPLIGYLVDKNQINAVFIILAGIIITVLVINKRVESKSL